MVEIPPGLRAFVDSKCGIVRCVRILSQLQRFPRLPISLAECCRSSAVGALGDAPPGNGIGLTREKAVQAAIGESIERYCGMFAPKDMLSGSWQQMSAHTSICEPKTFNSMVPADAPGFSPLTESGNCRWARGLVWRDQLVRTLAPWSLVCLGANELTRTNEDICYPGPCVSTGLACASTFELAAARAVLECCERDATICGWYTRRFAGFQSLSLIASSWPTLYNELLRCDLRPWLIETTMPDLRIPSYICAITPRSDRDCAAFGMASGLSTREAAGRALIEGIQTWVWASLAKERAQSLAQDGRFLSFESRVVSYGGGLMRRELAEFFESVERAPVLDCDISTHDMPDATLPRLLKRLSENDQAVLLFDVTTEDVRDGGLVVVRAVCPSLQGMESSFAYRSPNYDRLSRVAKTWDHIDTPHPFP